VGYGKIDHGAVEQIYHQLQKNYDSRLDYRKANDFHYGEMEMRRLEPPSGLRQRRRMAEERAGRHPHRWRPPVRRDDPPAHARTFPAARWGKA